MRRRRNNDDDEWRWISKENRQLLKVGFVVVIACMAVLFLLAKRGST